MLARAARQHTAFSRRQALADGMTPRQLQLQHERGRLVLLHRGVYGLAGAPSTFERSVMAACLAARGVASHRSAGALWGLRGIDPGPVEVTVPGRRRSELAGVLAHTTGRLEAVDLTERLAIPVTSPARTLLDLGAVAPFHVVEAAVEDAVFRGLVTVRWLGRTVERLGRPGRGGAGVLRHILAARDPAAGATESELEDGLWRIFGRFRLPEPRRQFEIQVRGGGWVRLDFAYPDHKLGIEADSHVWHSGRADLQRDRTKSNLLLGLGWRILHFTAYDIRRRPQQVAEQILQALAVCCVG